MKVTDINNKNIVVENSDNLSFAIAQLEHKKLAQENEMKQSLDAIKESFKPANLVKSAWDKFTEDQTPLQLGLKAAAAIGTAFLAKKAISKKEKPKQFFEDDDKNLVEVRMEKTPLLTSLALTAASNYVISKIPVVTAYTSAAVNQLLHKSDKN